MLREIPSRRSKCSNRRTPRKQSRSSIRVQRSPITATERATEQGWSESSFHFICNLPIDCVRIQYEPSSKFRTECVMANPTGVCLIVGVGDGLGSALARTFAAEG